MMTPKQLRDRIAAIRAQADQEDAAIRDEIEAKQAELRDLREREDALRVRLAETTEVRDTMHQLREDLERQRPGSSRPDSPEE